MPGNGKKAEEWSSKDKFAVVLETASLNEAELAEYCRRKGLFIEQIAAWRAACQDANEHPTEPRAAPILARDQHIAYLTVLLWQIKPEKDGCAVAGLPDNMSASEHLKFVNEVRTRYGRAFIESNDIGRSVRASNGEIPEGVAMVHPSSVELRGPGTPRTLTARLMEQPGCSNKVSLD